MAPKIHLLLVVVLVAGVASALAERDSTPEKDLSAVLLQARKLLQLGGPVRKQLSFDSGSTFGAPSPKGGYGDETALTSPLPAATAWTSPPVDRGASLSGSSSTSGSQSAASTSKQGDDKKGSTAAAVVGTLIGLVVVGVLTLFAYKQYNKSRNNQQRYSTYNTFDNEMAHVRY